MSYKDKVIENKKVAEKCMSMAAYNAGVTRAYYSAFQHIKDYMIARQFDYKSFLKQTKSNEREYSHGTLQAAVTMCLMKHGKKLSDVYKLRVLDNLYARRRKADYDTGNTIEAELKTSLEDLDTILSIVT